MIFVFFFFKQKTAYEMRISDWSSDVCSSDLDHQALFGGGQVKVLGNRGCERTEDHPDHEGEIEIEQGRYERRPVAARPEPRFGRRGARCCRHRPSLLFRPVNKPPGLRTMGAHPAGFIALWA